MFKDLTWLVLWQIFVPFAGGWILGWAMRASLYPKR